jgi:hypothetical protein
MEFKVFREKCVGYNIRKKIWILILVENVKEWLLNPCYQNYT